MDDLDSDNVYGDGVEGNFIEDIDQIVFPEERIDKVTKVKASMSALYTSQALIYLGPSWGETAGLHISSKEMLQCSKSFSTFLFAAAPQTRSMARTTCLVWASA